LTPFGLDCVGDRIDCLKSIVTHGVTNPARFMIVAMLGLFTLRTTDDAGVKTAMKDE